MWVSFFRNAVGPLSAGARKFYGRHTPLSKWCGCFALRLQLACIFEQKSKILETRFPTCSSGGNASSAIAIVIVLWGDATKQSCSNRQAVSVTHTKWLPLSLAAVSAVFPALR
jgi:hypothetical protein